MDSAGWLRVLIGLWAAPLAAWVTSQAADGWFLAAVVAMVAGTLSSPSWSGPGRSAWHAPGRRRGRHRRRGGGDRAGCAGQRLCGRAAGRRGRRRRLRDRDFLWSRRLVAVASRSPSSSSWSSPACGSRLREFKTGIDPDSYFSSVSVDSFALILAVSMLIGGGRLLRASSTCRPVSSPRWPGSSARARSCSCRRHRHQHRAGRDRRQCHQAADLPRLDRDDPGRRGRRARSPGR